MAFEMTAPTKFSVVECGLGSGPIGAQNDDLPVTRTQLGFFFVTGACTNFS